MDSHRQDDLQTFEKDLVDRNLDRLSAPGDGPDDVLAQRLLLLLGIPDHSLHLSADGDASREDEHLACCMGAMLGHAYPCTCIIESLLRQKTLQRLCASASRRAAKSLGE